MAKTRITPRVQHADKTQTFLNDIVNAIEVFEDEIGSMSSAIKQKSYKNFLLSYREALTPIWNLVQFAAVDTILDTIADKEFKELAVMANKLQPKEQQPRVIKEATDVADLEVITETLKLKFPQQSLPSKEICAQIGEVFVHLHNAHKEYAAAAEGLAQLATSVSPDQYTMILNTAALPKIQLVIPGTMLSPMTAPPPPEPQPSTVQGRESIISYTKSQVLPNPHSTALAHIDKNSATRVLAAVTYTKLEHKYFDTMLSRANTMTAFGCNISQLTKAVTGILYKSGPHYYVSKSKATKKRPCDTMDPDTPEVSLKKKKTEKCTSRVEPSTSTVITPCVEPSTSTAVPTQEEDTLSSSSSSDLPLAF